jgi:hypothetical protein
MGSSLEGKKLFYTHYYYLLKMFIPMSNLTRRKRVFQGKHRVVESRLVASGTQHTISPRLGFAQRICRIPEPELLNFSEYKPTTPNDTQRQQRQSHQDGFPSYRDHPLRRWHPQRRDSPSPKGTIHVELRLSRDWSFPLLRGQLEGLGADYNRTRSSPLPSGLISSRPSTPESRRTSVNHMP